MANNNSHFIRRVQAVPKYYPYAFDGLKYLEAYNQKGGFQPHRLSEDGSDDPWLRRLKYGSNRAIGLAIARMHPDGKFLNSAKSIEE